jgi:hypothetical protein
MRVPSLIALSLGLPLTAQEIIPARTSPSDYKASVRAGTHTVAADFQAHTVPAPSGSFLVRDYVVLEIAVFPDRKESFVFDTGKFSLRMNGKKSLILAQTPGMVAASLKYPSWEQTRGAVATAGVGDAGVILGRDTSARFPGDRRAPQPPIGTPPRIPGPESGIEKEPEVPAWDWVTRLAWEDGPVKGPAAGLLYFPYKGNLAKIMTLELILSVPDGEISLRLR